MVLWAMLDLHNESPHCSLSSFGFALNIGKVFLTLLGIIDMQDDEAAIIGIGLIIVVVLSILAVIAGLVNAIEGFLISIGLPQGIVGEFGSILFFGILFILIMSVMRGIIN